MQWLHLGHQLRTIVVAEIGDCLEIGGEAPAEPDQFKVALRLPFQAATRLNPIEITVNVEFQQGCGDGGVIAWPASRFR